MASGDLNFCKILQGVLLNDKLRRLLPFLLRKYQQNEQITMEEMLHLVEDDYREQFPLIFRELCESMRVGCAIDIREIDPRGHTYALVPTLGLTYNGMLDDDDQIISKVDLLIFVLTLIFTNGNRVSEEELKQKVRRWEILAQIEHIFFAEPWKFITEDLVREQYLVYRQVPNSKPACYEFLWGPRAHSETSKMKVLVHVSKLNGEDPRSYPDLYEEALREEQGTFRAFEGQDA